MTLFITYSLLCLLASSVTWRVFRGDWKSDLLTANAIVFVDTSLIILAYPVALTVIY